MPGGSNQSVDHIEQRRRVVALRCAGLTFRAIGSTLGISHQLAHRNYRQEMAERTRELSETVEEARELAVVRFEELLRPLWTRIVLQGGCQDLEGVEQIRKLMRDFHRLLGVDVPQKIDINLQAAENVGNMFAEIAVMFIPEEHHEQFFKILRERAAIDTRAQPSIVDEDRLLPDEQGG